MCGLTLMDLFVLLLILKLSRKTVFGYILFPQAFPELLQSFDVRIIKDVFGDSQFESYFESNITTFSRFLHFNGNIVARTSFKNKSQTRLLNM